tara:strand:- start:173 stop:556 length:384 start_codon:yes stop_codon:yes gene_type:complete
MIEIKIFQKKKTFIKTLFILMIIFSGISNAGSLEEESLEKNNIKDTDFERIFFRYSIPYEKYDSIKNQFNNFLGYDHPLSKNRNFQDLSIANDSYDLRNIYNLKIIEMTKFNKKNKIYDELFYKKKI